jgi:hypothetical protein
MVGVLWHDNDFRFNILMRDGSSGDLKHKNRTEIRMAAEEQVAKIVVYWPENYTCISGCRFYGKDGKVLLEFGDKFDKTPFEFALADGEKVLGIKSRLYDKYNNPRHEDCQFIIGRLE